MSLILISHNKEILANKDYGELILCNYFGSWLYIYSNKKETSDFHGTLSYDTVKMLQ